MGTLYTSETARYTRTFGYAYPEVVDWNLISPSDLSANVRAELNKLYNPSSSAAAGKARRTVAAGANTMMGYEYFVNIRVATSTLKQSFFIHFFLGEPTVEDSREWGRAQNLITSHSVLSSHMPSLLLPSYLTDISLNASKASNVTSKKAMTYGQISLTHALLDAHLGPPSNKSLISLHPTHVIPFLHTHLQHRIQLFNDTPIHPCSSDLQRAGLRVFVVGRTVEVKEDAGESSFPTYGSFVVYRSVTSGWAAGLREGEGL